MLGAICGFLIAADAWTGINLCANLLAPHAFAIDPGIQDMLGHWHSRLTLVCYYSFSQMTMIRIIATRPTEEAKSKREIHTAAPTAQRLRLEIEDARTHGHEADLASEVLSRPESVLIVWHHGTMAKIVRHFPVVNPDDIPARWTYERFDLIWVLVRQSGPARGYRFVCVPQMLLADNAQDV